jgi:hypothetical protein
VSPVVSLDVLPADVPAEYAPAMVAACSDALAEGSCAMAATLPESTRPDAVGLVLWQGEQYLQVTVRVGRGNGQWLQRALTFSERDSISERFTTVGLTVATLVGETMPQPEPAPPPPASLPPAVVAPSPPPVAPTKPAAQPTHSREYLLRGQLGALVGPSWDRSNWQKGGWVSVGFQIPHSPFVAHAFGSYALSSGPIYADVLLTTSALTGGIGAGIAGTWDALSVRGVALVELAIRRLEVEGLGRSAADEELPVRLRLSASFPARGPVGVMAGAALRIPPASDQESDPQRLKGPAVETELLAGLEIRL